MSYKQKILDLYKDGKVDEVTMIKMAAFQEEVEKLGGLGTLGKYMGIGALASGTTIGAEYLLDKKVATDEANKAAEVFEKIYKNTPEINKYDKKVAQEYFNSLLHHSPKIATDPVAARSYLLNMLMWEGSSSGVPVNHFLDLAQITNKNPTLGNYFISAGGFNKNLMPAAFSEGLRNSEI